jgi:hypothetical protein
MNYIVQLISHNDQDDRQLLILYKDDLIQSISFEWLKFGLNNLNYEN